MLHGDPRQWGPPPEDGTAVSIGVYDGVHRGHQAVVADLAEKAEVMGGLQRAVLTFDEHPQAVLRPERAPRLLTTIERRLELLEELGVDVVGVLPFRQIRTFEADDFVCQVLVRALGARVLVVGSDFRFGRDRAGSVDTLRRLGAAEGFVVDAVPLLRANGPLSSSVIRGLVAAGDVAEAGKMLGRPVEVTGTVVAGEGRGADMGIPTANLDVPPQLAVPARGVYAGWAKVGGRALPAVINVGIRPTFGGGNETVEAHLLDFEGDVRHQECDLLFAVRLRDERRFDGPEALLEQIGADIAVARRILAESPGSGD